MLLVWCWVMVHILIFAAADAADDDAALLSYPHK